MALDPNGNAFPVAYSFVADNECGDNWTYHLTNLKELCPDYFSRSLSLTDRQKGLDKVLQEVIGCPQAVCCAHIVRGRGKVDKGPIWALAKASTPAAYDELKRETDSDLVEYLERMPKETWSQAHMTVPNFGHQTSNIVEGHNKVFPISCSVPCTQS